MKIKTVFLSQTAHTPVNDIRTIKIEHKRARVHENECDIESNQQNETHSYDYRQAIQLALGSKGGDFSTISTTFGVGYGSVVLISSDIIEYAMVRFNW